MFEPLTSSLAVPRNNKTSESTSPNQKFFVVIAHLSFIATHLTRKSMAGVLRFTSAASPNFGADVIAEIIRELVIRIKSLTAPFATIILVMDMQRRNWDEE
jgi:hypothetical protein